MSLKYVILSMVLCGILLLQPVLPYIEYYTFRTYIIKNLCINRDKPGSCCKGKCFLEKSLKETSENNPGTKAPSLPKTEQLVYTLPYKESPFIEKIEIPLSKTFIQILYKFTILKKVFRPPEYL